MTEIDPAALATLAALLPLFPHIASDIGAMRPDDLPGLARTLTRLARKEGLQ